MTAVFPTLPGLAINVKRSAPIWSTAVQSATSGKEQRAAWWSSPKYTWDLTLNFLRQTGFSLQTSFDEAATLSAFFTSVQGQFGTFWFPDPYNSSVTAQAIGTGTGAAGQTSQLVDVNGVSVAPNGAPSLYVNGVLQTLTTNYTVSATGLVTWVTAPGNGLPITWTGSFYYTCRFLLDQLDLERIVALAWKGGSLKLTTVK